MTTEIPQRQYFDKAWQRKQAMESSNPPHTIGVAPMAFKHNSRMFLPKYVDKCHMEGSRCVAMRYDRWSEAVRQRIVARIDFVNLPDSKRCCTCEFDRLNP